MFTFMDKSGGLALCIILGVELLYCVIGAYNKSYVYIYMIYISSLIIY